MLLSEKVLGQPLSSPMPINVEIFKNFILSKNPIKVKINNQYNVFVFQSQDDENVQFKYIVSALVK
jgi:hypothetical protein